MEYLLPHLLTNSAARYPQREAVRMNGAALTYEQLDVLSNQVARVLRDQGVRRGDRVAIYVNKSFASVIGVYGIMKAGGVYVPLDPNAPAKRLSYITRDCGVKVVLTSPAKLKVLPEFFTEGTPIETVVVMDDTAEDLPRLPENVLLISWKEVVAQTGEPVESVGMIETDLAYILYTSGSTGMPKGVMIAHRTILTFINWCRDTIKLTADDRVTSHAPLHFDLSTFDLYATMQAGGTIILVPETLSTLPVQLVNLLQNEGVTITYLVPSILSLMVNFGDLGRHDLSKLRTVLFAGEVFPMKYLRRLVAAIPHAGYYNLYGPTETNVCTYYKVQQADLALERGDKPLPIGQACENMEVFAVNEAGERITEPGQEGELWARGSCVAQGYWGDSQKTAKSFVLNPFQPLYPEFAYRTGDVVTLAEDRKNWLYVGRRDHMIKTRGYRVELGEIENALYRHDEVKEAAAIAIADELLGNRIRAFVVLAPNSHSTPQDLEKFCSQIVPKYMVPEKIELRDMLPKTSSGKIDRTALVGQK
jgi:amino acid adenylation domain-containing protein